MQRKTVLASGVGNQWVFPLELFHGEYVAPEELPYGSKKCAYLEKSPGGATVFQERQINFYHEGIVY